MTIEEMQKAAHENSRAKGWWDEQRSVVIPADLSAAAVEREIPGKLMLIVSEVAEALEEFRAGHPPAEVRLVNGKPEGIPAELADVVIRIGDLCGALGIDLQAAIAQKMAFNATRPHRHGGKRA